jgi:hypothetical protein
MEWWMYVLVAAGLVVVFDVLLVLWLGLVTREPERDANGVSHE